LLGHKKDTKWSKEASGTQATDSSAVDLRQKGQEKLVSFLCLSSLDLPVFAQLFHHFQRTIRAGLLLVRY
jgi:hypothetical protein